MTTSGKLLYACDANWYYATRMELSDPALWYQDGRGQTHTVQSALEITRAQRLQAADHVHSYEALVTQLKAQQAQQSGGGAPVGLSDLILHLWQTYPADSIQVPFDFPAALFVALQKKGVPVQASAAPLFPQRGIKRPDEVAAIRRAQAINAAGFQRAFAILAEASIGKADQLLWQGEVLTSELLRGEMNATIARLGGVAASGGPIVACGPQAADPHERGHGPLYAHQLIIIDSFPQGPDFYYGDLTRTVLKGRASDAQQKMYTAVYDGQMLALERIQAGAEAAAIDQAIRDLFAARGFTTGEDAQGRPIGYFHSTGHSVGLAVHDQGMGISQRYRDEGNALPLDTVVTVEPGLYYPDLGGVRLEDIVHVTATGCDNLTVLDKFLVIP